MAHKLADDLAYPPRAMRGPRAAAYFDMSSAAFFRLVDEEIVPQGTKVHGVVTWDRLDLDAAYEDMKTGASGNTMHAILKVPSERPDKVSSTAKDKG